MLCPGHQIRGREGIKKRLLAVGRRVRGIDPVLVVEHAHFRIGVSAFEHRIARAGRLRVEQRVHERAEPHAGDLQLAIDCLDSGFSVRVIERDGVGARRPDLERRVRVHDVPTDTIAFEHPSLHVQTEHIHRPGLHACQQPPGTGEIVFR